MAVVQGLGAEMVVALMRAERGRDPDLSWLLFGPDDDCVVDGPEAASAQAVAAE